MLFAIFKESLYPCRKVVRCLRSFLIAFPHSSESYHWAGGTGWYHQHSGRQWAQWSTWTQWKLEQLVWEIIEEEKAAQAQPRQLFMSSFRAICPFKGTD